MNVEILIMRRGAQPLMRGFAVPAQDERKLVDRLEQFATALSPAEQESMLRHVGGEKQNETCSNI